jgi:hypothetical protein
MLKNECEEAGGQFKLELFLPEEYPMAPPKVRFLSKIYHPNLDKIGRIVLLLFFVAAPHVFCRPGNLTREMWLHGVHFHETCTLIKKGKNAM